LHRARSVGAQLLPLATSGLMQQPVPNPTNPNRCLLSGPPEPVASIHRDRHARHKCKQGPTLTHVYGPGRVSAIPQRVNRANALKYEQPARLKLRVVCRDTAHRRGGRAHKRTRYRFCRRASADRSTSAATRTSLENKRKQPPVESHCEVVVCTNGCQVATEWRRSAQPKARHAARLLSGRFERLERLTSCG
jgi:hypothetical protein